VRACARCSHSASCALTAMPAVCERACARPAALCRRAEVAGAVWHVPVRSAPAPAACVVLRAPPFCCLLYVSAQVCDPRLCAAARKMHVLCGTHGTHHPVSRAVAAQHLEGVTPGKLLCPHSVAAQQQAPAFTPRRELCTLPAGRSFQAHALAAVWLLVPPNRAESLAGPVASPARALRGLLGTGFAGLTPTD
jgi:hypothetical protein